MDTQPPFTEQDILRATPEELAILFNQDVAHFTNLTRSLAQKVQEQATPQITPNTSATESYKAPKSEKHPDPPVFNGNITKWREFKTQLRVKLQINHDRYITPQSRLAYIVSRLEGNPLHIIQPRIINGVIQFSDMEDLISFLNIAYEDQDLVVKAQRELRELRQRNREFYNYFADFQRIIEDTGITDNEARKSALMGGLSTELHGLLVHHDIPAKFDDLVRLLQGLDSRYRLNLYRNNPNKGHRNPNFNQGHNYTYRQPQPVIPTTWKRNPDYNPNYNSPIGDPMDLGTTTNYKLPKEELNRRNQQNLCRYCGNEGHYAQKCPLINKRTNFKPNTLKRTIGTAQKQPKIITNDSKNEPSL